MGVKLKTIWGIDYEEIIGGDIFIWKLFLIEQINLFSHKIRINEKFIRAAQKRGIDKFILSVEGVEISMAVPTKKDLEKLDKEERFEIRPARSKDELPMKIYHFELGNL